MGDTTWFEMTGSSALEISESGWSERDIDDISEAEYCPGYSDEDGVYQAGFHCPLLTDSPDNIYCCGTDFNRYCCDTNSNSFLNGLDPAAIVGALLAMVVVLLVCVSLCCCCCSCCLWNRRRNSKSGKHVIRYNNLDGTVNTTVSTSGAPPSEIEPHLYPPSAPPGMSSTASPPFNPHMPPMSPQSQQMPQPMPQPYPSSSYTGASGPYPSQNSCPPPSPQDGYPCKEPGGYPSQTSSLTMQAPPPYHDSHNHHIGFTTASAPPPDSMPYVTKI